MLQSTQADSHLKNILLLTEKKEGGLLDPPCSGLFDILYPVGG